jgi:CBS domain containing-hemolysin-like protein
MMVAILSVSAILATLAAAYCAYADGALLSIDDEDPALPPAAAALVQRREQAHRALAFGRILAQLLAGAGAVAALKASAVPAVQVAPLVIIAGVLIIVLAESAARAAGDIQAERAVEKHARGIHAVENLLSPVVALGVSADKSLDFILPKRTDDEADREASVEQFREVVAAEANVSREDERLLRGVFSLGETQVQDIMVPRVDVIGVSKAASWDDVVLRVRQQRHARYVVYEGSVDNVTGILHAKDMLPSVLTGTAPANGWQGLARPALYIPGTKLVDQQLKDFKASRQHMAVVVDEFGGTAGIVTLEDALEVIVGDIRDEHDVEEPDVKRESEGVFSISALVTLDDLSELTGDDLTREGVNTVGGLVLAIVGGVPKQGDSMMVGAQRLTVERVARRRVERVRVERVATAEMQAEE